MTKLEDIKNIIDDPLITDVPLTKKYIVYAVTVRECYLHDFRDTHEELLNSDNFDESKYKLVTIFIDHVYGNELFLPSKSTYSQINNVNVFSFTKYIETFILKTFDTEKEAVEYKLKEIAYFQINHGQCSLNTLKDNPYTNVFLDMNFYKLLKSYLNCNEQIEPLLILMQFIYKELLYKDDSYRIDYINTLLKKYGSQYNLKYLPTGDLYSTNKTSISITKNQELIYPDEDIKAFMQDLSNTTPSYSKILLNLSHLVYSSYYVNNNDAQKIVFFVGVTTSDELMFAPPTKLCKHLKDSNNSFKVDILSAFSSEDEATAFFNKVCTYYELVKYVEINNDDFDSYDTEILNALRVALIDDLMDKNIPLGFILNIFRTFKDNSFFNDNIPNSVKSFKNYLDEFNSKYTITIPRKNLILDISDYNYILKKQSKITPEHTPDGN